MFVYLMFFNIATTIIGKQIFGMSWNIKLGSTYESEYFHELVNTLNKPSCLYYTNFIPLHFSFISQNFKLLAQLYSECFAK